MVRKNGKEENKADVGGEFYPRRAVITQKANRCDAGARLSATLFAQPPCR